MAVIPYEVESVTATEAGPETPAAGLGAWFTIERLLYTLAVCAAGCVRFWQLGGRPLLPAEAANAWPAYVAAQAQAVDGLAAPTSALLYGLQWLTFWLGAHGDVAARVVGAAAGSLVVALPWLWRDWLGRHVALALAWLIALDPWLVAVSRLGDGAALGTALGLLCLTGLARFAEGEDPQARRLWLRLSAASAGLLLVSGVLAWSWLPVLALFGWLYRERLARTELLERNTAAWVGGAALLGGSFALARPDGFAAVGASLSTWLDASSRFGTYGMAWPWLRLVIDEPLVWMLGLVGLAGMHRQRHVTGLGTWAAFLMAWLGWGAVLALLPGRSPLILPMIALPLLFGAAWSIGWLARARPEDLDWREVGAIAATLAVLLVSGSFWAAALVFGRMLDPVMAQATIVIFVLAAAIVVIYGFWASWRHAAWIGLGVAAIVLGMMTVRSGWQLNHLHGPAAASGFYSRETHPEVQLLVQDIETLSAHRAGTPHQLPVQVQVASGVAPDGTQLAAGPDPVLGWYLRAMREVAWVPVPSLENDGDSDASGADAARGLAITWADDRTAASEGATDAWTYTLPEGYAGSVYQIELTWPAEQLGWPGGSSGEEGQGQAAEVWSTWLQPLLRWLVYRQPPEAASTRDVILWSPLAGR